MLAVTLIDFFGFFFFLLHLSWLFFLTSFLPVLHRNLYLCHLGMIWFLYWQGRVVESLWPNSLWSDLWRVGIRYRVEQLILILKGKKVRSLHHLKNHGFHIFTWYNCNFPLMGQSLHLILPTDSIHIWMASVWISHLVNSPSLVVLPNIHSKLHNFCSVMMPLLTFILWFYESPDTRIGRCKPFWHAYCIYIIPLLIQK